MEQLVAFVILINTLLVGFMLWGLFKFFPQISRANIHRATTDQHMEIAARSMDPAVSAEIASEADIENMVKPMGVTQDLWENARLLSSEHGITIDDAIVQLQAEHPDGDEGPHGA